MSNNSCPKNGDDSSKSVIKILKEDEFEQSSEVQNDEEVESQSYVDSPGKTVEPTEQEENSFETISSNTIDELPGDHLICELLGFFSKTTYDAFNTDPRVGFAINRVTEYLTRDYIFANINNKDAMLSKFYPSQIPFLQSEKRGKSTQVNLSLLRCLVTKAQNARCRQRFPVPVILCKGKFICRSATIAGAAEVYGRTAISMLTDPEEFKQVHNDMQERWLEDWAKTFKGDDDPTWRTLREGQYADLVLLEQMNIGMIVDLMVEYRKTKMGLPVTSSEKAEANSIYSKRFDLVSLPYPGCEFFKDFTANAYCSDGLVFDFNQPMCNADLNIPNNNILSNLDWHNYKKWDLTTITKNYLLYILKSFQDSDSGILVHCISGWDRTPLFISLIRLSLWADGLVHQNLNVAEIVYFVLAYDWFLFGHHLSDRLHKSEDILLFCFMFLKELASDEFKLGPVKCGQEPKPWPPEDLSDLEETMEDDVENDNNIPEVLIFNQENSTNGNGQQINNGNGDIEQIPEPEPTRRFDEPMEEDSIPVTPDNDNNAPAEPISEHTLGLPKEPLFYTKNRFSPVPMRLPGEPSVGGFITTAPVDIPSRPSSQLSVAGSTDSWQMVSGTGSVRSDSDIGSPDLSLGEMPKSRRERLMAVRKLFIKCYFKVIRDIRYTKQTGILNSVMDMVMSQQ